MEFFHFNHFDAHVSLLNPFAVAVESMVVASNAHDGGSVHRHRRRRRCAEVNTGRRRRRSPAEDAKVNSVFLIEFFCVFCVLLRLLRPVKSEFV
ncbi:MAG: hypothetical protein ABIR26_16665, partial [Ramlibacter sp.]